MTHHDHGNYRAKHPLAEDVDKNLALALRQKVRRGYITCAALHKIASEFKISPSHAGISADLMEFKIGRCQLGLFGYGPENKILHTVTEPGADLLKQIIKKAENRRISCSACWQIAADAHIARIEVARACESIKIKISSCQLGSFR